MTYPNPNFTTPGDWAPYAATVTGGMFWDLILAAIFIIAFGTLSGRTTTERALGTSAFLTGILAAPLYIISGIQGTDAVIFLAAAIGGFILLLFTRD